VPIYIVERQVYKWFSVECWPSGIERWWLLQVWEHFSFRTL